MQLTEKTKFPDPEHRITQLPLGSNTEGASYWIQGLWVKGKNISL